MKVLMFGWEFAPFISGGLGTACRGLTKGLNEHGVDLTFVLPRKLDIEEDFVKFSFGDNVEKITDTEFFVNSVLSTYNTERKYSMKVKEVDLKKMAASNDLYGEVLRYEEAARGIAAKGNFDLIHVHDWMTIGAGVAAKEVSGKPLIIHVHTIELDRSGGRSVNPVCHKIEKEGFAKADLLIANSNLTRKRIHENYGVPLEKIRVVHNATEFSEEVGEESHPLKKNKKIVLSLGRLTIQKGVDYLISAAKRVSEVYPDAVFVVVGDGEMKAELIHKAASLGIADKVIFTGWFKGKDVERAYKMADLFIMPSVSEPFGIAALESAMKGTPVLLSKTSGAGEILANSLRSDFWDVDDMANKIVAVLKHKELHSCLKNNGMNDVRNHTWNKCAKRCVDIYDEMVGV